MKIVFIFSFLLLCKASWAGKVIIQSSPVGASVSVVSSQTGEVKNLGKTPYEIDMSLLKTDGSENNAIQVKVHKEGFESFNVILPPFDGNEVIINANLRVIQNIRLAQDFDLLVSDLFDALRMTRLKDYQSSNKKIDLLVKKFPQFSIVYEMKGMNFYLQKEFKKALNFYRKAFSINPKNAEAYKMKRYLEKKFKLKEAKL